MNNKKTFWYKSYLWWKYESQYFLTDFIKGVKNTIKWLPIIWKDRDYDHSYIFIILKNKLKNQADYLEKCNYTTDSLREVQKIRTCVKLINKIQDEFYRTEYLDYQKSDIRFIDSKNNSKYKEVKIDLITENFNDYFKKYKLQYKKISSLYLFKDKQSLAMEIAKENSKKAKKILFSLLENNIENWWN